MRSGKTNRVTHSATSLAEAPRRPQIVCKVCCGIPWARDPGRHIDGKGDCGSSSRKPVVGPDGLCLGCGLGYAPEPEVKRNSTLRSSAAMALVK